MSIANTLVTTKIITRWMINGAKWNQMTYPQSIHSYQQICHHTIASTTLNIRIHHIFLHIVRCVFVKCGTSKKVLNGIVYNRPIWFTRKPTYRLVLAPTSPMSWRVNWVYCFCWSRRRMARIIKVDAAQRTLPRAYIRPRRACRLTKLRQGNCSRDPFNETLLCSNR